MKDKAATPRTSIEDLAIIDADNPSVVHAACELSLITPAPTPTQSTDSPAASDGASADGANRELPRPRPPRVRTLIHASLAGDGKVGGEGIVRNVSPGGLCIASRSMTPAEGDLITISLAGRASLQAQVRWTRDGEFGVLLTSQVNPLMARPVTPPAHSPVPAGALRRWLAGWREGFGRRTAFEHDGAISETTA